MDRYTQASRRAELLQEGVSSAAATIRAISDAALLDVLPAEPKDRERHNDGIWLLAMLGDQLDRVQEGVDALARQEGRA